MRRSMQLFGDLLRQADLMLFSLCSLATFYGMLLILSATHTVYNGTLRYVAVQGVGYLLGSAAYFLLSSLDVAELSKKWKWVLAFNVGFIALLLTPFGMVRNGNRAWLGVNDIGRKYGIGILKNFHALFAQECVLAICQICNVVEQVGVDGNFQQHCDCGSVSVCFHLAVHSNHVKTALAGAG